jgi:hypothetical protein
VQRAVCKCVVGGVLCSGLVLVWRKRSVSLYLVLYCVALCYWVTESGVLVCIWWCVV